MPKIRVTGFSDPQIVTEGDLKTIELARQADDPNVRVQLTAGNFILKDIRAEVYDDQRDANTYLLRELGFKDIKKFPYEYSNSELKEWMGSWYSDYLSRVTDGKSLERAPVPSSDPAIIQWGVDIKVIVKRRSDANYDYWAIVTGQDDSIIDYERFRHRVLAAETIKERAEYAESHEVDKSAVVDEFPKNKEVSKEAVNSLLNF